MLGALLALVANALHPHPSDFQLEALLQAIALSAIWGPIHLVLIFSLLLIFGALLALTLTLDDEPAATVARFACLAVLLGGALMLVSTAMDGFAMSQIARSWADAAPAEKASALRIAAAAEDLQYAVYSLSSVIFLGIGIFLYGLTMILSRAYPKLLGWLAVVAGAGAFVVGIAQVLGGPEFRAAEVFDVLFSVLSTVWILVTGVLMWRKARGEQTVEIRA
ncbi:MAG: DUF4386 family protein [Anaerolineae bacterium]|nr:DUF4386 family protein [Anaerolineae bacterium]